MAKKKQAPEPKVIEWEGMKFVVEYRELQGDRGPAVKVFGQNDAGKEIQLLRFDIFENDPHYHYTPDGPNDRKFSIDRVLCDPIVFLENCLLGDDFQFMLEHAGAGHIGRKTRGERLILDDTMHEVLKEVEKMLRLAKKKSK